jgi:hypothetical protein
MIRKDNGGHWKIDLSAVLTAVVIIATVVAMHYTAVGELRIADTTMQGNINAVTIASNLRLKEIDCKLIKIDVTLERLNKKIDAMRTP